ncbi:hypothetical protein GQ53DRAFT_832886 [Thozetella sp. PMI_491]|nr:hypothetical protein GQ53DRAFT_832886 [Thozetella sp. PMI_491]
MTLENRGKPIGGKASKKHAEFGPATEYTHVLGPGLAYFQNPARDNKYNFHDGKPAVTKAEGPVNYLEELFGKDSLETAANTFQNETVTQFTVQSGGRLGGVLGEDANEL